MLTTAIQVNLGMINLNETEVTKKLAGWAALIAVPTLIAGIYGMNFKNMPELEWAFGYYLSLALMLGIDAGLYRLVQEDPLALNARGRGSPAAPGVRPSPRNQTVTRPVSAAC